MQSKQRGCLAAIVDKIAEVDRDAGIVLQGSVAFGTERPGSDVDLTIVTNGDPLSENDLINRTNRGSMIRARLPNIEVDIDINWESFARLEARFLSSGAMQWYIFSHGEVLHDPLGLARRCQSIGREYFERNPRLATAWKIQNAEVAKKKRSPDHVLQYSTWSDFARYLETL